TVQDQAIAQRLQRILTSSGRFDNVDVQVEEGIVYLKGETQSTEFKDWAEKLVQRTEGVIAVINQLDVDDEAAWSFQPAVNETVSLYHDFVRTIPKIVIALILLLMTWLLAKITYSIGNRVFKKRISNPFVMRLVARLLAL